MERHYPLNAVFASSFSHLFVDTTGKYDEKRNLNFVLLDFAVAGIATTNSNS